MFKTEENNVNHLIFILKNLRREDLDEVIASFGKNWEANIIENTVKTNYTTLLKDNIPIAIGGVVPLTKNRNIACVWLLCTKDIKKYKFALLKELKTRISQASLKYTILYNFIYKSNSESIKWLKKLGFKFDNPHPKGLKNGADFSFFYKTV